MLNKKRIAALLAATIVMNTVIPAMAAETAGDD